MIEARNLWKTFGDHTVLERINITVSEGEFVTLVGASGCGKTTFLKMLLGVESVSRGTLNLDGVAIPQEPGSDRGVVFQQYSVFPHMSVLENVVAAIGFQKRGFSGYLFGQDKTRAHEQSMQMLEKVGLTQSVNKYPHELSCQVECVSDWQSHKPCWFSQEFFCLMNPSVRWTRVSELICMHWCSIFGESTN